MLFKGFPESRDENCGRTVIDFLETKLGMDELPSIERAHRLGRFSSAKGPRPIIVPFSFYKDTEDILSSARVLKGTSYGISRDYPQEITRARQKLWPQYKAAQENPLKVADFNFGCATFCALPSFGAVTTFSSPTTFSSHKVSVTGSDIDMCSVIYISFRS